MVLKNKNILITGAGKGIGLSTVIDCLKNGAEVFALTRTKYDLESIKKSKNLHIFYGNVNNQKIIKKIFNYSKKIKKPINCLVNNAGLRQRKKFIEITNKDLRDLFEVNFFSIFKICQLFVKNLNKNEKGSVINIGSIVGTYGFSDLSGYASSKKALEGLTKCLAVEFGEKNIYFNCINPGFTKTSYFKNFKKMNKLYKWTKSRTISGKWGEPDDVSYLICFLLSSYSEYINGQIINIDGGWTAS